MICSFCAYAFDEADGLKTCGSCAAFGGCRKVKCPRCGYEMPQVPDLLKFLKRLGKRRVARTQ
jgi:hypothetical protein